MKKRKLIIIVSFFILLTIVLLYNSSRLHNQGLYKVTFLPTLGENFTMPRAINDKGQVAGYTQYSNGDSHLFLWDKENGIRDLGLPCDGVVSLNNSGQIASNFVDPNGNQRAFFWDPNTGRTILPTLGGKSSLAFEINNNGQIAGHSDTSSGIQHAFCWDNINGICDLTPNSTSNTIASSINDSGQVIIADGDNILVKVQGNQILSSFPIPLSSFCRINNNGYIAGLLQNNSQTFDAAIWHPTSRQTSIIKLDAGSSAYINKINDLNQVIITEFIRRQHFFMRNQSYVKNYNFLYDPKLGLLSLDGYIKLNKGEELGLNDINNNGCIIGTFGSEKDMNLKGALFEPIPEKMEQFPKK